MGNAKKVALVLILLALIIGAVMWIVKRNLEPAKPPKWVQDQQVELVDQKTLEVMTKTRGEWDDLGNKDGIYYKNPKTGTYSMVTVITCPSCGKKIPGPVPPKDLFKIKPGDTGMPPPPPPIPAVKCPYCNNSFMPG